jgi:uncharacterized protein (DUF2147 family)
LVYISLIHPEQLYVVSQLRRRIMRAAVLAGLTLVATVAVSFAEQSGSGLQGTWLTEDGSAKIRFEPCASALCGRIVWLREPNDPETGKPILDKRNPDPALRSRRLLGIAIFTEIQPVQPREWRAKAYNAEDSKTYSVTLKLTPSNRLTLTGCGLFGLVCKSETWMRAR